MISICIPVYNCNVTRLIDELNLQCNEPGITAEIVIIDDRSSDECRNHNDRVCRDHKYILLEKNVGRSRIRNLFLKYARYDQLLFLDCDSAITSRTFIRDYVNETGRKDAPVLYGGLTNEKNEPARENRLRWKYGIEREDNPATLRNQYPYRYFRTNNFLTDRKVLGAVNFDERIVGYGYEDTLFAYQLMKRGINIRHIHNPVLHCCRESNEVFLEKAERGVVNLIMILDFIGYKEDFISDIRLLRAFRKISKWHLDGIARFVFRLLNPGMKFLLNRGFAGLWLLDFYKLGHLLRNGNRDMKKQLLKGYAGRGKGRQAIPRS